MDIFTFGIYKRIVAFFKVQRWNYNSSGFKPFLIAIILFNNFNAFVKMEYEQIKILPPKRKYFARTKQKAAKDLLAVKLNNYLFITNGVNIGAYRFAFYFAFKAIGIKT